MINMTESEHRSSKITTFTAVKCFTCGKLHDAKGDTFLSFHGNVCVGTNGGIIGNNFDDEGKVNRVMIFCRKESCLRESLLRYIEL